ncbi:MAG: acetolactate synthase small subunit [Rhodothermales bacterium]|nr:acetolactate synthase small subunit [Rhodothermales bacterium]
MTEQATLTPQQIIRRKSAGEPVGPDEVPTVHRHVITVLLENSIGALNRVTNMFSARGFNLESVSVGPTDRERVSRLTLVTTGNDRIIGQVLQQLRNLVDTLVVDDVTNGEYVERELCLVKVSYTVESRPALMDIVEIFRGNVINITPETMTFEVTGPTSKINAFIGMMKPHGINELARSGRVAMRRHLAFEG